jgi:hypothetical protein
MKQLSRMASGALHASQMAVNNNAGQQTTATALWEARCAAQKHEVAPTKAVSARQTLNAAAAKKRWLQHQSL